HGNSRSPADKKELSAPDFFLVLTPYSIEYALPDFAIFGGSIAEWVRFSMPYCASRLIVLLAHGDRAISHQEYGPLTSRAGGASLGGFGKRGNLRRDQGPGPHSIYSWPHDGQASSRPRCLRRQNGGRAARRHDALLWSARRPEHG